MQTVIITQDSGMRIVILLGILHNEAANGGNVLVMTHTAWANVLTL